MTHISYEVSKKLKEFLGDSAPEPIGVRPVLYCDRCEKTMEEALKEWHNCINNKWIPAYQLHDLLSKPFCEAMAKKCFFCMVERAGILGAANSLSSDLRNKWFLCGGLLAVEKELIKMMGAKQ